MITLLVEASGVARRYGAGRGQTVALEPASFSVERGDRIAVVGPSGSGKSTLLNLIAGLDRASAGHIAWPALGPREALRPLRLGMAHQFPALVSTLTVAENVALPLRLGHLRTVEPTVADALAAVGLEALADRLPGDLSGGQAQRVAIAQALAHRPLLLLADEPTGQLDSATGQAVITAMLERLPPEAALIVATHDRAVAERLATLWRMDHGRLATAAEGVAR